MDTRSTVDAEEEPVDSSSKAEATEQAETDEEVEVEPEGKAPAHDASNDGHKAPTVVQAQDKAELAKVAQTLREDATEGETTTCPAGMMYCASPGTLTDMHVKSYRDAYTAGSCCCVQSTREYLKSTVLVNSHGFGTLL